MRKCGLHIHTPVDGRGNRDVFVNGRLVKQCIYVDERKGVVKYCRSPLRTDKYGKRVLTRTLRGHVTVVAKSWHP